MNKRIEIVSDYEVNIERNPGCKNRICIAPKGNAFSFQNANGGDFWDAEGLAALRDCVSCLEATGSFAAPADTSPVGFVGKEMALTGGNIVTLIAKDGDGAWWYQCGKNAGNLPSADILPLVAPAPMVLPYTPPLATVLLGRLIRHRENTNSTQRRIVSVCMSGVVDSDAYSISYESLADSYVTVDTIEPCGTIAPTP